MLYATLSVVAVAGLAAAQRPSSTPICDYYTTALFGQNTAENQYKLVSAVVNRAGTGNKTSNPQVNGIAAPGMYQGQAVDISVYFTGALNSTNRGGSSGVSVNFLDDGGAVPLLMGKPANGTSSNQYKLFTHLYEYFGALLMCSQYGMQGYPSYEGKGSQYDVHKFMDLDEYEVGYFNEQVGLSAASFGVTQDDVTAIGKALDSVFNVRCAPPTTVVPAQGPQLQSICIAPTCQLAANSTCASYPAENLKPVNITTGMPVGNGTASHSNGTSSTGSSKPTTATAPAQQTGAGSAVGVGAALGAVALALAL